MNKYKVILPLMNFKVQALPRKTKGKSLRVTYTDFCEEAVKKLFEDERFKELVQGVELYHGVKLRPTSQEDITDLMTAPHMVLETILSMGMFVLEKHVSDEEPDYQRIDEIMHNVVLAMRLLKAGSVRTGSLFFINMPEKRHLVAKSVGREPVAELYQDCYVLSLDEIPLLKRISEKIQGTDISKQRSLKIACNRLEHAVLERDAEEKLVDLVIGFEALFFEGKKIGPPYWSKIADRCSGLLGKSDEEREEIRFFIEKAYAIRNTLVHGSEFREPIQYKEYTYLLSAFVPRIEDYLRRAIRKSLKLN